MSTAGTRANVKGFQPRLWIGPVGENIPDPDDLAPPSILAPDPTGNWVESGFIQEQIGIQNQDEYEPVIVIGHLAAIKGIRIVEGCILAVKYAEHNAVAYNDSMFSSTTLTDIGAGADQTQQQTVGYGDKASNTEKKLLVQAINGAGGTRFIEFHIALAVDQPEILLSIQHQGFDAGFTLYADHSQSAGETIWLQTDIIAQASS